MCLGSSDPNAKEDVSKETLPKPVPERKAKAKAKAKAAQTKAKACFKRPAMADSSTAKKPKTAWRGETGMCISGNNPVPDFVSDDDDEAERAWGKGRGGREPNPFLEALFGGLRVCCFDVDAHDNFSTESGAASARFTGILGPRSYKPTAMSLQDLGEDDEDGIDFEGMKDLVSA